jgi:hypothetical protein
VLLIGGKRHGDDVTMDDGQLTFVDIVNAETYYRRQLVRVFTHPVTGRPVKALRQELLVHEHVPNQQAVQILLGDLLALRWFEASGTELAIQEMPSAPNNENGR